MTRLSQWTIGIHLFVGVGAGVGGSAAILNPLTPLGISPEMLENGPFSNFLIPGLFLLVILGLGNFITSYLIYKNTHLHGIFSGLMGAILVLWILVQCYVLQDIGVLHVIFFLLGSVQMLMAFILLYQQNIFPVSLVKKVIERR
jgi:hypothetical protein